MCTSFLMCGWRYSYGVLSVRHVWHQTGSGKVVELVMRHLHAEQWKEDLAPLVDAGVDTTYFKRAKTSLRRSHILAMVDDDLLRAAAALDPDAWSKLSFPLRAGDPPRDMKRSTPSIKIFDGFIPQHCRLPSGHHSKQHNLYRKIFACQGYH